MAGKTSGCGCGALLLVGLVLIVLPLLLAFEFLLQRRMDVHERFAKAPLLMQLGISVTIVLVIALFGVSAGSQFIYFPF